jgi:hypothetical protein
MVQANLHNIEHFTHFRLRPDFPPQSQAANKLGSIYVKKYIVLHRKYKRHICHTGSHKDCF